MRVSVRHVSYGTFSNKIIIPIKFLKEIQIVLCNRGFNSLDSFLDWELLHIGSSHNFTLHSCAVWGKLLNLSVA